MERKRISCLTKVVVFPSKPLNYEGLTTTLNLLYRASGVELKAKKADTSKVRRAFKGAVKKVYDKKGFTPDMLADSKVKALIDEIYNVLSESIHFATGEEESSELIEKLDSEAYNFSGFKTYHQMNEASGMLQQEGNSPEPFTDYLNRVKAVDAKYNENWLQTEYNLFQNTATAAQQWEDYSKTGNRYDLQYRTAADDRVREEHAALHGTTLPFDDPFWDMYYPPNGYNCFVAGTQILTGNGTWKNIESIKKGDLLIGGSGKIKPVIGTHVNFTDCKLIRITTKGRFTTCTPNHRILTSNGWTAAGDITKGDIIIQIGKVGFLNKCVNAINNLYVIGCYCAMSFVRQWNPIRSHTVNSKIDRGDIKINDITPYKFARLKMYIERFKVFVQNALIFTKRLSKSRHVFRMFLSCLERISQSFLANIRAQKRRCFCKFVRNISYNTTVRFILTLPIVLSGKSHRMIKRREARTCCISPITGVNPLSAHSITTMSNFNAGTNKNLSNRSIIYSPYSAQIPEASKFMQISDYCGIDNISTFNRFNSFYDFIRKTFFHNRYVFVQHKDSIINNHGQNVYNLSIKDDESYIIKTGIVHNCRCNVIQVIKGKYKTSDSSAAIEIGNKMTEGKAKSIFRYNPGKTKKPYPSKHPYMPQGCGDCKKGLQLAYSKDNPACLACMTIQQCKNQNINNVVSEKEAKEWIKDTIEKVFNGKTCKTGIAIYEMPEEIISFAKRYHLSVANSHIILSDKQIKHTLRDVKVASKKAISTDDMINIKDNLAKASIYYDDKKKNYLFITNVNNKTIKYAIEPNYSGKINGEKKIMNYFITAGIFDKRHINSYTKIK